MEENTILKTNLTWKLFISVKDCKSDSYVANCSIKKLLHSQIYEIYHTMKCNNN